MKIGSPYVMAWSAVLGGLVACAGTSDPEDIVDPGGHPERAPVLVGSEQDPLDPEARPGLPFRPDGAGFASDAPGHEVRYDGAWVWMNGRYIDGGLVCSRSLGIATESVSVGRTPLPETGRTSQLGPRGELVIARGGYAERFVNRSDGLEQSWVFQHKPSLAGDLIVRVAVAGHEFRAAAPSGLHFYAPGDLGSHYGHGVWIDADGEEYEVPSSFEGGRIVLRVPASVVASSTFPAVLDPEITLERPVDAPIPGSPTGAHSISPAVAFSGAQFLAVWHDNRGDDGGDIYATRMTASGVVSDSNAFVVTSAPGIQANPTVALVGGAYLVVWEDYKLPTADPDIMAARVSTSGVVTQLGAVAASAAAERRPRIAVRGSEALVVFESNGNVTGSRFAGGAFGAVFDVATGAVQPSVAADPAGGYLVAFTVGTTGSDLRAQLVSPTGVLTGGAFDVSAAAGAQALSSASFAGGNFIVAWQNNQQGRRVYATRVSPSGAVLDTRIENAVAVGGLLLIGASAVVGQGWEPGIACSPGGCLVTWQDRRSFATLANDVYAQRFGADLVAVGGEIAVATVPRDQRTPRITQAGPNFLIAWQDLRDTSPEHIYGARVRSSDGAVLDAAGILIARGNNRQTGPAAARGEASWFLSWSDSRTRGNNILGVRANDSADPMDSPALSVSNAPGRQQTPVIAASGVPGQEQYLIAWSDQRGVDADIYAARVSETGQVLDLTGFEITTATRDQLRPAIASSGQGHYLVVWQDRRNGFDIFGAIIDLNGQLLAADIPISTAASDQLVPTVAFDPVAGQFLVAWDDARPGAPGLYAARVTTQGAVLDPAGVLISNGPGSQFDPKIAFGSDRFLMIWENRLNGAADIYGARVRLTVGGIVVEDVSGLRVIAAPGKQEKASLVYLSPQAGAFAVAWVDERNLSSSGSDIYGNVVFEATGTAGADFQLAASSDDESGPVLSRGQVLANDTVRVLLAYERQVPALATHRVVMRRITYGDVHIDCQGSANCNADCPSGSTCEIDCQDATNCNPDCMGSTTCVVDCTDADDCVPDCWFGSTCQIDCTNTGDCEPDCFVGSTCQIDCTGTNDCRFDCWIGSTCEIDCAGTNDCRGSCLGPGTECDIDCTDPTNGSCDDIDCQAGAQCLLRCDPSDPSCGFDTCQGGQTTCPGNIVVCNRPCP